MSDKSMTTNNNGSELTIDWQFWAGLLFFVIVMTLLMVSGWRLFDRMMADQAAPISSVVISGEMPYTQMDDIQRAISADSLGNFFQLDVNSVQQTLEQLPWVMTVSVRKQWPSQLSIYVVDHVPTAIWNDDKVISNQGVVIAPDLSRLGDDIPKFYGPVGSEKIALENYQQLNALLNYNELNISEMILTKRFAWQLTLNDGVKLNLGREERVQRVQRFIDVYPEILVNKKENQHVDYIDLRYDTGVAVGWKQAEDERV